MNPAYGYWDGVDLPQRKHYEYQTWSWPPKVVATDSSRYGEQVNAQPEAGFRGFKTDSVTNMLANAFIRGSIVECIDYVAGSSD